MRALEFTQHQRDVFCVFSGNMVTKFRDFLNTSPQFEELRENLRAGRFHDLASSRRAPVPNPRPGGLEAEGFDEEMADEDNDFDDGSEMVIDAQMQNPAMTTGLAVTGVPQMFQAIPVPPPPPSLGQHTPDVFMLNALYPQGWVHPALPGPGPRLRPFTSESMAFMNLINNRLAGGPLPPNVNGHMPASVASLAHGSNSRQVSGQHGGQPRASTATVHRVDEDEDGPADLS